MIELKSFGMESHQGPHLNINEDVVDVDIINNMYLLIDGFGGSNIGDKTAGFCRDLIKRSYTKIAIDPDSTLPFYYSHKYLLEANALINAFHLAHREIIKTNEGKSLDQCGGASVLAAGLSENILTFVSTGNCAAFLYRKGHISQEVLPDSLVSLSRDSQKSNFLNLPMSGVGLFEDLHYSVREIKLAEGDLVVMLSDGAYARILLEEMRHLIQKYANDELQIIEEIFKLANSRGNLDNQSAIILQY